MSHRISESVKEDHRKTSVGGYSCTGTEFEVCCDIAARQALGMLKYKTTVAENTGGMAYWIQNAYEEALDLAIYLKRLQDFVGAMGKATQKAEGRMKKDGRSSDVTRILRQYTRVVKMGDKWNAYLQIDHQGFTVVENTSRRRAQWFAKMLAIALERMLENRSIQPPEGGTLTRTTGKRKS
jgi:hypothetical protein